MAVDAAVDELARERRGGGPAVGDRLGVHVPGEHDPPSRPERQLAQRVRPVADHRLQRRRLEAGAPHEVVQEFRERPLVAEHARDPAHPGDEVDEAVGVNGGQRSRDGVVIRACAPVQTPVSKI